MIIDSSKIQMTGSSTQSMVHKRTEQLTLQNNNQNNNQNTLSWQDQLELSKESLLKSMSSQPITANEVEDEDFYFELSEEDKEKISLLKKLLESLTGKKVQFYVPKKFRGKKHNSNLRQQNQLPQTSNTPAFRYERHDYYKESASMSFKSSGTVKTKDGRTIDFDIQVSRSRQFESSEHFVIQSPNMQDPLTINYGGESAHLTKEKYEFDITGTGQKNNISFVKNGSGFLALDKNKDGIINDGTELFGPKTGNGFLELAAFDDDGNGWIDENDQVFEDLLIWTKDSEGKDELFGLLTKDVGAIYLGNVTTQYGLKDSGNNLLGQIASTGIYMKESGGVGTVQHIDLSV